MGHYVSQSRLCKKKMQFDTLVFMQLMVFAEHLLCVSIVLLAEHAIKNKLDEFLGLPPPTSSL